MEAYSVREIIVIIFTSAAFTINLRLLYSSAPAVRDGRAYILRAARRIRNGSRVHTRGHLAESSHTFNSFMEMQVMAKRLQSARSVRRKAYIILNLALAAFAVKSALKVDRMFHFSLDVVIFFGYIIFLVLEVWPELLTKKTLKFVHSACFFLLICANSTFIIHAPTHVYLAFGNTMFLIRCATCLHFSAFLPNLIWNFWYSVSSIVFVIMYHSDFVQKCGMRQLIGIECFTFWCIMLLIKTIDRLVISKACSDIEAEASIRSKATAQRLLSALCDAVVDLGPTLNILHPSQKFAALLRQTIGDGCKGECFSEFVLHESDHKRLEMFISKAPSPSCGDHNLEIPASSLHLSLRATNGACIPVQIFHSSYYDTGDQLCHILGIKEDENHQQTSMQEEGSAFQIFPITELSETLNTWEAKSASSTSASEQFVQLVYDDQAPNIAVWFEASKRTLPIVKCTATFTSLTGPITVKTGLQDLIININEFRKVFEEIVNADMNYDINGQTMQNHAHDPGELELQLRAPHVSNSREMYSTCKFRLVRDVDAAEDEDWTIDEAIYVLHLSEAKLHRKKKGFDRSGAARNIIVDTCSPLPKRGGLVPCSL